MKSLMLLFAITGSAVAQTKVTFDEATALPAGWKTGITGTGAAKWEVVRDDDTPSGSNVLKQSGEATYCWAAKTDVAIKDGFAEVKFRPISGKEDQAGGLIFRVQDGNNYYVVRGNALENNVVLYKTVNGKRSSLAVKGRMFGYGVDAKVASGKWNTLRVDFVGKLFTVSLNGSKLFEVEDETIKDAGGVGVWTKADSVTVFDDFTYGTK
ncbi:MAG: family 16 glycoside hydrolase [Opitutaceae bacterium]